MSETAPESKTMDSWKLANLRVDTLVKPGTLVSAGIAAVVAWFSVDSFLYQAKLRTEAERKQIDEEEYAKINRRQLELTTALDYTTATDKKAVLTVEATLTNRGKEVIRPCAHAQFNKYKAVRDKPVHEGCTVKIYRHDIDSDVRLNEGSTFIGAYNLLDRYTYGSPWYETYSLKPQSTYHETQAFALDRGYVYEVITRFYVLNLSGDDKTKDELRELSWSTNSETRYIHIK